MISIVLPAYNEEPMIEKAADAIHTLLSKEKIEHELLFVDDGSKDGTWEKIDKLTETEDYITGIHLSRNFGKEAAIFAGLSEAGGSCCAVMDCDLQHPPETLIDMYHLWEDGYEVIEGVKKSRGKESALHRFSAGVFYKLISKAIGIDMQRASDFKLLDRQAVDALLNLKEKDSFFRALSLWIGYRHTEIEFDVRERETGESKWSTWSLIKYALHNIVSFSAVPMQIVTICGIICLLVSVILGIQTLAKYFSGSALEGFTTIIVLLLFIGSLIMLSLGVIGYYMAQIYEEIKGRPKFIISIIKRKN